MVHHRLEHLGRRDDGLATLVGLADEPLLHDRHPLERQLHSQISARDHDGVARGEDVGQVLERLRLLDLRDQFDAGRHEPPQILEVVRPPHERQRQVIRPLLHGVRHVLPILVRERRCTDVQTGEVHPLVRGERAAVHHAPLDARRRDAHHLHRQEAVVEQDASADPYVLGEIGVRGRELLRPGDVLGREDDRLAGRKLPRRGELPHADTGALQVHEHGDRLARAVGGAAHARDPAGAELRRAVRGIDADDVRPGLEQRGDRVVRPGSGADRGDDLGAANHAGPPLRRGGIIHIRTQPPRCGKLGLPRVLERTRPGASSVAARADLSACPRAP